MRLHHVTIRYTDLEATVDFYRRALGLEPGYRPAFSFPGAWLSVDGGALVHLKPGTSVPLGGPIDHIAFHVPDFEGSVERLRREGIAFKLGELPDGSLRQCIIRDPDGTVVELTGE